MGMQRRRGGLGRGLEALIPGEETGGRLEVEVDAIAPNPTQPRTRIDPEQLAELAASIRQHGIIQPLVVTRRPAGEAGTPYILITGERRWRAAAQAGLATVPVVLRDAAPQELLELALVENVQRQDLNALEEAEAYRHLIEEFGLTQEEAADRVGKSRTTVTNILRLLGLPAPLKEALAAGEISEGHARALLSLTHLEDRLAAFEVVRGHGLTVRETEALVRRWGKGRPVAARSGPARDPDREALEDRLRTALNTRVEVVRKPRGKGGRLVIHYFSDEEFDGLYRRLVGDDE